MSGEKARYRVLRLSHIHNNLWPEGSEVEYDGEPGTALEPLNDAARAAKAKAKHKGEPTAVVAELEPLNDADSTDDGLDKLREEYEFLFNEKPHHNAKAETLREKIADKRKELGV
ncbi:hypothetical protein QPN73_001755 [Salmonella enterica]|nr:hypothetical protein [Salmonella enterica]EBN4945214.1 hypothetical protein [Salmonella enterica]EKT7049744.1 hypothetical protein [Salmonella enterica]ELS3560308.1 hypothetical protein [Salmonella enterica]